MSDPDTTNELEKREAQGWRDDELLGARNAALRETDDEDSAQEAALKLLQKDRDAVTSPRALAKKIARQTKAQERRTEATRARLLAEAGEVDPVQGGRSKGRKISDHTKLVKAVRALALSKLAGMHNRIILPTLRDGWEARIHSACERETAQSVIETREWTRDKKAAAALLKAMRSAVRPDDDGRDEGQVLFRAWVTDQIRPLLTPKTITMLEGVANWRGSDTPRRILIWVVWGARSHFGDAPTAFELALVGLGCGWLPIPRRPAVPEKVVRAEELACDKYLRVERYAASSARRRHERERKQAEAYERASKGEVPGVKFQG